MQGRGCPPVLTRRDRRPWGRRFRLSTFSPFWRGCRETQRCLGSAADLAARGLREAVAQNDIPAVVDLDADGGGPAVAPGICRLIDIWRAEQPTTTCLGRVAALDFDGAENADLEPRRAVPLPGETRQDEPLPVAMPLPAERYRSQPEPVRRCDMLARGATGRSPRAGTGRRQGHPSRARYARERIMRARARKLSVSSPGGRCQSSTRTAA